MENQDDDLTIFMVCSADTGSSEIVIHKSFVREHLAHVYMKRAAMSFLHHENQHLVVAPAVAADQTLEEPAIYSPLDSTEPYQSCDDVAVRLSATYKMTLGYDKTKGRTAVHAYRIHRGYTYNTATIVRSWYMIEVALTTDIALHLSKCVMSVGGGPVTSTTDVAHATAEATADNIPPLPTKRFVHGMRQVASHERLMKELFGVLKERRVKQAKTEVVLCSE